MGGEGAVRVNAQRLDFQIQAGEDAGALGEARDLHRSKVLQNGNGQRADLVVVALEFLLVNHLRLLEPVPHLRGDVTHDMVARGPLHRLALAAGEARAGGPEPQVFRAEVFAQLGEVKLDVVGRSVLSEGLAVPVKNLPAHRRYPHGADGLIFEAVGEPLRGKHLHIPQPAQEHTEARYKHERHHAELRVGLFDGGELEHQSGDWEATDALRWAQMRRCAPWPASSWRFSVLNLCLSVSICGENHVRLICRVAR